MALISVDTTRLEQRYEFNGTALPTDWNIVELGAGQTVTVASSVMAIATGTTASASTTVRCTRPIRTKFYARFIAQLSQRIANQNIYFEVTNAAGTTFARYDFNGTTSTTAQAQTGNGGTTNTAVSATVPTTASYASFDIYADATDVVFSSVAANTNAIKSGVVDFDRNALDPNEDYYVQIRVLNGATAPATSTTVNIDAVVLQDLTGVSVNIVRGDGTAAIANSSSVQVLSMPTVSANATAQNNVFYNESVVAQAAAATVTGTARDTLVAAAAVHRYSAFNASAFADQAGTLRIEVSNDNTTWRRATADTAVAANAVVVLTVPVMTRYHRAVFINGATLQTAFMLNTSFTG